MPSIQIIGFQCVVEEEKNGKKVEKQVGRVYTAKSACEDLVAMYKKAGKRAWLKEIYKVEDNPN